MPINRKIDPTGTNTLQNAYRVAMSKIFDYIIKLIRISVGENNCLLIGDKIFSKIDDSIPTLNQKAIDSTRFRFLDDSEKVIEFNNWVNDLYESDVFGASSKSITASPISPGLQATISGPAVATEAISKMWFSNYMSLGYLHGLGFGKNELLKMKNIPADIRYLIETATPKNIENLLTSKVHFGRLKLIYSRNYELLKGVTADMSSNISRILTNGLATGTNPKKVAKELSDTVSKLTRKRATLIARTEMIRAHNHGAIAEYEEAGLEEGLIQAEIATAHDNRVCPICAPYDKKKIPLKEALSLFPRHPQCRCAVLPYNPEWE